MFSANNDKTGNIRPLTITEFSQKDKDIFAAQGVEFHTVPCIKSMIGDERTVPRWGSASHDKMAWNALIIVKNDKGTDAYDKLNETVPYPPGGDTNGGFISSVEAWKTDETENDLGTFLGHFYGKDGKNYLGLSTPTAYQRFNNHYYQAVTEYNNGNKYMGYAELGRSIHYLQDLNVPHHAANRIAVLSNHLEYEDWVDSNIDQFLIHHADKAYYDYVMKSSFLRMANDFSSAARATIELCESKSFKSKALKVTKIHCARTQRAAAGLFYRFLRDTGRL